MRGFGFWIGCFSVLALGVGCGDDGGGLPVGATCSAPDECSSGLCGESVCLDPSADDDGDGLNNGFEVVIGTSPLRADTDADGLGDFEEVGSVEAPANDDLDGVINAAESLTDDLDADCLVDQEDDQDGLSNLPSEDRPRACGNGQLNHLAICGVLRGVFEDNCADPVGEAFACFNARGSCTRDEDAKGTTFRYASGASYVMDRDGGVTMVGSTGEVCLRGRDELIDVTPTSGPPGSTVAQVVFNLSEDGGVFCPDGENVEVPPELSGVLAFCLAGGNGCGGTDRAEPGLDTSDGSPSGVDTDRGEDQPVPPS